MSTAEPLIVTPLAHSREHLHARRAERAGEARNAPNADDTGQTSGEARGAQRTRVSEHARRTPNMSAYFTYTDSAATPFAGEATAYAARTAPGANSANAARAAHRSAGTDSADAQARAASSATYAQATTFEHNGWPHAADGRPRKKQGRVAGAVQFAGGMACMAIGVPLLILPGPGLALIAGGAVLATRGASNLLGGKRRR